MSPFSDGSFSSQSINTFSVPVSAAIGRGNCFTLVTLVEDNGIDASNWFIKIVPHSFTFYLYPWQPRASHFIKFLLGVSRFAHKVN